LVIKTKLDKNEKITKELSTEWANDWFTFADTDGDGSIDQKEFKDFVKQLDKKKTIKKK